MRPPRLRPRLGLLGKFALASLIPIVLLGFVLARYLEGQIRGRALANARQSAELTSRLGIQPLLTPADLEHGLTPARLRAVDRALRSDLIGKEVARIKIWARSGHVVYSDNAEVIGRSFPVSEELEEALDGEIASEISDLTKAENAGDRRYGELLEVYVPLRFGSTSPAGAFEIYLPYRPIAAAIRRDSRATYLLLLGGLSLLYAALFRIVANASRRLRRQAEENEHQALHDALTDLPNRSLFGDRAAQALRAARRDNRPFALMILDLDRFKEVNDTLGHHNGDLLLREIAARLQSALRESDSVARLGGDEFGLLLPQVADAKAAIAVADKVRQALRRPFALQGVSLALEASVGIALYPDHGEDVETLLQRADVAMYTAKEDRSGAELYSHERDEYSPGRLALVGELRRAIDEGELLLYYQPKAELKTGRIVGVEALVRWRHPERGMLLPEEFVPLAERTGLISDLTRFVLGEALQQANAWQELGIDLNVSVNLSTRDLLDLELPETIERLLVAWRVPPERLELEITESVIIADPMRARLILTRLSELGVQVAIDDFGSGYSSLGYLKRLPVGELKIDKSFVLNMAQDENDAVIVRSTIELGRNLGLKVVAEGVETVDVWRKLSGLNCDFAQGYYLTEPLPAAEIAGWLRTEAGRAGLDAAASG